MTERKEIKHRLRDFANENGVDFFAKNRGKDVARGGSIILTDKRKGCFKKFEPFKTRFETVAAIGTVNGALLQWGAISMSSARRASSQPTRT